jgi:hypothetical protein
MLTALPLISWFSIGIAFYLGFEEGHSALNIRRACLDASIVWALLLTIYTEALSVLHRIESWTVAGLWVMTAIAATFIGLNRARKRGLLNHVRPLRLSRFDLFSFVSVAVIVMATGLIAFKAPPNTFDSMTYHMARVAHWMQNRSVEFYPTHISRQLYMNPWAEFAIMHLQILGGADRFANFVQWFSMVGSIVGVSLIARELGAGKGGQVLAIVVAATIPMGIVQASSTQNDWVVTFWLVCFVYYVILLRARATWAYSLAAGCSLGLAILTKPTAYLYALPFLVWMAISWLKRPTSRLVYFASLIAILIVVINLGHYARNARLYGSPFGPGRESKEYKYTNDAYGMAPLISNVARNVGLHLGTPIESVNTAEEGLIRLLHKLLGIGINDPSTTWGGTEFHILPPSNDEDTAGNPVHLLLIVACGVFLLVSKPVRGFRIPGGYAISLLCAAFLFAFVLKWQPWHSRLHLALFVLWAPFIATVFSNLHKQEIAKIVAMLLLLAALPAVIENRSRPLIKRRSIFSTGRFEQYFASAPAIKQAYMGGADFLHRLNCSQAGLVLGGNDWEYPLWVLLQTNKTGPIRIEHVNVTNISKVIEYRGDFRPCAIVSVGSKESKEVVFRNETYSTQWSLKPVSVFVRR